MQQRSIAHLQTRGVSDPVEAAGEHAWAQFRMAETRLAEARANYQLLHPGAHPLGAETSPAVKGKPGGTPARPAAKPGGTPARPAAESRLHDALAGFATARERLDNLGLDVRQLRAADAEAHRLSLLEHPRLPGGGSSRLDELHLSDGLRFQSTAAPGAFQEAGHLIDHQNSVLMDGTVTHLDHGGFRITDLDDPARFREYNNTGVLIASGGGVNLTGPQGLLGHLDPDAGHATLHRPDGETHQFTYARENGNHLITDANGLRRRFDAHGGQLGFELPVRDVAGVAAGRLEVDVNAGSAAVTGQVS
ncbi:hypothetical protein [Candidatus Frankia nodulisporulans]|uniref:hypothetical protein n=1 Tax=Candidatus Frankia nodulisporulans TaxID=2060052 RepID=UPI001582D073|nr:hypothetical protein [Candidatus Frankia nodulisporulans]